VRPEERCEAQFPRPLDCARSLLRFTDDGPESTFDQRKSVGGFPPLILAFVACDLCGTRFRTTLRLRCHLRFHRHLRRRLGRFGRGALLP